MSRPVCHLELELTPAEWGVLLSRVNHAERLEELSLEIILVSGTLCLCGQVCKYTFTCACVLVCYVFGNGVIFGCSHYLYIDVCCCICWIVGCKHTCVYVSKCAFVLLHVCACACMYLCLCIILLCLTLCMYMCLYPVELAYQKEKCARICHTCTLPLICAQQVTEVN